MAERSDGRRRQWLAVDAHYPGSDLALGLRERFGLTGMFVFDLFLRACKRNHIQGEMTFMSEADFLNAIGLPGAELRNERGDSWSLDEFFSYLGQQKNTRRRRSGGITVVRSTRWEQWENRRSRPRDVGPMPARNESGMGADNDRTRQDTENENDNDGDITVVGVEVDVEISPYVWSEFARRKFAERPAGAIQSPVKWMAATERMAREEHWMRAQHLLRNFSINDEQLVVLLLSETSPAWLSGCRKEDVS